ncbi:MAG: hypothetical protein ACT4PS_16440 [Betaproteobacteria bacterium]
MLKRKASVLLASGLLLAPLGGYAMASDSPFPQCIGADCTIVSHDDLQRNIVAAVGDSTRNSIGRTSILAEQRHPNTSPFPENNSND